MSAETWRLYLALAGWFCFGWCAFAQPDANIRRAPPAAWISDASIVRIKDGDTAVFEVRREVSVRFLDCWCGEVTAKDPVERKLGIEAEKYLQELKQQNPGTWRIEVPTQGADEIGDVLTFGRVLALVYLPDGRCVNDLLVANRLAGKTKKELAEMMEARRK